MSLHRPLHTKEHQGSLHTNTDKDIRCHYTLPYTGKDIRNPYTLTQTRTSGFPTQSPNVNKDIRLPYTNKLTRAVGQPEDVITMGS